MLMMKGDERPGDGKPQRKQQKNKIGIDSIEICILDSIQIMNTLKIVSSGVRNNKSTAGS
jgi:hypothetical protein